MVKTNCFIGLLLLICIQNLSAQCAEAIQVVNSTKIQLTFDLDQDTVPTSVTYGGEEYFLSPTGSPNVFFVDNVLPGGTDMAVELTLNFAAASQPCVYSATGSLDEAAPVDLSQFSGRLNDNNIELHWTTESEVNNAGFEIQRSYDGHNYETIAFVEGHGTTEYSQSYSFEDSGVRNRALNNIAYYRLKQIDFDGKRSYSYIIGIDLKLDIEGFEITKITGWNTGDQSLSLYYHSYAGVRKIEVILATIHGNLIERKVAFPKPGMNKIKFDLPDGPSKMYIISINNGKTLIAEQIPITQKY